MSGVNSTIQPIDKTTVNQICSGQAILNLATAVKELLENSIDAGANSIQIKLEEYGADVVEVSDNGCGIEEVNFQALTLKHHTSKITQFSDLYAVETFGFRGEALSSLCSLSNVTIITQHKNASIGATLKFDHNGIITSNVKTSRKTGTTVKLENLFSTLPIRRTEFLKNLKREFSKMCNVLYAYGLQSSGVRITCSNHISKTKFTANQTQEEPMKKSSTTVMDTRGESVESNIVSVFGVKQKQNLIRLTETCPSQETLNEFGLANKNLNFGMFKLDGYISSCAHKCGRTNSDRQFYYINSRPVDNCKISKLVNDTYHQFNIHQDPFVVLNIKVETGLFDINVTPDKRQIFLQNEKFLLATLKESLLAIYRKIPSTLEVQNIGLIKSSSDSNSKNELLEKLAKLKENLKNARCEKDQKAENESRINKLFSFRRQSQPSSSITSCRETQNLSNTSESKPAKPSFQAKCKVIQIILPENVKSLCKTENGSQIVDESTTTVSNENSEIIKTENVNVENSVEETFTNISNVSLESSSLGKNKRTLLEEERSFKSKNISEINESDGESEEIESKRMKLDEGLSEEDKSNRKCITYNISLNLIKKVALKHINNQLNNKNETLNTVKFLTEIKPQNNEKAENELKKEIKKESFKQMEIIGQFNLGFIITKLDSDVFIIDQHASDEKYNFETLQLNTVMQSQKLFTPERLELPVDREELMLQHKDVFKKNGFDFVFNENELPTRRISLTSIPLSGNVIFGKEDVDELLFFLENAPELKSLRPSRVDSMFAMRACRKSVMIGTPLNHQEMRKIVDHMGEIEQPWNCPHGRPTMRHLINLQMLRSGD